MGWHLDGRVTAVVGTHTHVQTADERVLPQGTAYITDVGMTGPHDSVIGVERAAILQRFLTALPQRFETATENPRLNARARRRRRDDGPRDVDRARSACRRSDIEALVAQPAARALVDGRLARSAVRRRPPRRRGAARSSVSELTARSQAPRSKARSACVAVEGEISNCKPWSSGHIYFTLKDDYAQIRAVMFRMQARAAASSRPRTACASSCAAGSSVYEVKGEYQLVCDALEPHGLGALQAAFEQLKRRLQAEGLFDAARKRPLPVLPRRIGVVTSLDGAALRDILRVLTTRHPTARVVVRPARVQGEGAADDLVRALARDRARAGRRRRHHRPRRRIGRGSLGVQRRSARARDRRVSGAGHLGRRPRGGLHDRRLRRRRARGDAVERRRARRRSRGQLPRAHRSRAERRLQRAMRAARRSARGSAPTALDARLRHWPVTRRDARARLPASSALRLAHAVARSARARRASASTALRRRLERRDVRRVDRRPAHADRRGRRPAARSSSTARRLARRRARARRWPRGSTRSVRSRCSAAATPSAGTTRARVSFGRRAPCAPGDRVRVTLAEGELACRVEDTRD